MRESSMSSRRIRDILLLAGTYAAVGWLARLLWLGDSPLLYASAIWPAAGIALGALLARGPGLWPGVWIGTFVIEIDGLLALHSPTLAVTGAGMIAMGTTLQALTGHALVRRFIPGQLLLDTGPATLRFFFLAGPLACLVSSGFGSLTLYVLGDKSIEKTLIDWLTWWSGDTIGVTLTTPVVLAMLAAPRSFWQPRLLTVALPLVFVAGLITTALGMINRLEHGNRQIEFEHHADALAQSIRRTMLGSAQGTRALADFFDASEQVSASEFARYARGVASRHAYIHALFWVPGDTARDGRFPVGLAYPNDGNTPTGFDLSSHADLADMLQRARHDRQPVQSEPIAWMRENDRADTLLFIVPVFADAPRQATGVLLGFSLAIVRLGTLLDIAEQGLPHNDIDFRLEDPGASQGQKILAARGHFNREGLHSHTSDFKIGDRAWQVHFVAGDGFQFEHRAWYAWATLATGVATSVLLVFFLLVMSGRTLRTEQLVAERTAELEAARVAAEKTTQLLHEAVSSIEQGFTIYDENDRLVICNEAYRRIYATSADLIVPGNSFEEIARRGAERGQYKAALGRIDEWVKERVAQHQNADGRVIEQRLNDGRWLLIVEHRTASGYIVGNRIDITNIKNVELALRESEARAVEIIENAPEPMLLVDEKGDIQQVNSRIEAVFGYTRTELLGQPVEMLLPENLRGKHRDHHRKSYAQNPTTRAMGTGRELVVQHKSGWLIPAEISLAPLRSGDSALIIVTLRDVTERRRAATTLEDRNAQLNAIFQSIPDGLISFDTAGRIKDANSAALHMTGLSAEKIIGRTRADLERDLREHAENPDHWQGLDPCFTKLGAGSTALDSPVRHLLTLKQPHITVIELIGVECHTPSISHLLYLRDVTYETEVDRMKSEFLSHAAHELRTPMASIYGFTELLVAQDFDAETRKDLLQTIHKQTAWLIEIINELLDISRIESRRGKDFRIEAVPVAPLLREVLSALQIDQSRWPVNLDLPETLPPVMADAAKLRQIFTNVIGNAVKYSPAGGAIAIQGVVDASGGKPFVGIAVADHGIGMTPEQVDHVCERFYRADTSGNIPGTGLGMAIVKEVIELLGGKIHVASAIGTGTAVTLWLPEASSNTISSTKGLTP